MKVFDFQKQLKTGKTGEEEFHRLFPKLKKLDGRKGDFELPNGKKLELKTDNYSPIKTSNFFMEVFSDFEKGKLGGPWQSQSHGSSIFVYKYSESDKCYWFVVDSLVKFLEENLTKYKHCSIMNKGWFGVGLLVPRTDLIHLETGVPKCLRKG